MSARPHPSKPGYVVVEVPNPARGKRYMMMELDEQLVVAVSSFIANGTAETELARRIEATMRQFLASQPIDLHLV